MEFGKRIRELRLKKQLNQKELGKLIGVSGTKISDYEREYIRPSIDVFMKFADVLDTTIDYLINGNLAGKVEHEITDKELLSNFKKISQLSTEERQFINKVINSLVVASKIKEFV